MSDIGSLALAGVFAGPARRGRGAWLPLFLMIGAAAVPIIAFAIVMLGLFNGQMERSLRSMMQQTARWSAAAVEARLAEDVSALQALGSGLDDGTDGFRRQAEGLLAARPSWLGLRVVPLTSGLKPLAIGPKAANLPTIDSTVLAQVVTTGKPAVDGVRAGDSYGAYSVPLYVPLRGAGQVRAVLVASVSARAFSDVLVQQGPPADWAVTVLDRDGRILGRSREHDLHIGSLATDALRRRVAADDDLPFLADGKDGTPAFTAFSRSAAWGWTIAVAAPAETVRAPMRRTMYVLASGGSLALLLAVWLGLVLARATYRRQQVERRLTAIQTLQTAERRLTEIARNFPGVIYRRILHPDGSVSYPYVSGGNADLTEAAEKPAQRWPAEIGALAFCDGDRGRWVEAVEESACKLEPFHFEGRADADDGALRWIRTVARPHRRSDGAVVWDGVALDITDLKMAEESLAASLAEKEGMLREIHHRVRNNLQVVSSLIQIEAFQIGDLDARRRLGDVSRRIGAMGHLHELLYGSTDFARIDCSEHLRRLCQTIQETQDLSAEIVVEAEPLYCDLDTAIPLGLLAHELVSFELAHSQVLRVILRRSADGRVELAIDCGRAGQERRVNAGLGSRIVHALAAQIDGLLDIGDGTGICALLRIDGRRFTD